MENNPVLREVNLQQACRVLHHKVVLPLTHERPKVALAPPHQVAPLLVLGVCQRVVQHLTRRIRREALLRTTIQRVPCNGLKVVQTHNAHKT